MRRVSNSLVFLSAVLFGPTLVGCGDTEPAPAPAKPVEIADAEGKSTSLNCPGSAGCENGGGDLLVGAAAKKITPTIETWTDTNANGVWDMGEPYEDANKNGKWDAGDYLKHEQAEKVIYCKEDAQA